MTFLEHATRPERNTCVVPLRQASLTQPVRVLVVEDEKKTASFVKKALQAEGFAVDASHNGDEGLVLAQTTPYDAVVLDIMLPGRDGLSVLRLLRERRSTVPVLLLSARGDVDERIAGLNAGADDYLAKPFHLSELAARIHSIIRRKEFGNTNVIEQNEIKVDLLAKTITINARQVFLTKKEFDLLLYFISNKNKVISKSALAEKISGDIADMFDNYDFVYAHIKNLKKKLSEAGSDNYLKTLYGSGYKWEI